MKAMFIHAALTLGLAFSAGCGGLAFGEQPPAADTEKTFEGIAVAMDSHAGTISVKGTWGTRTFNLGKDCLVLLPDKHRGSLAELHPGQKLELRYADADGVRIAREITRENMVFTGYITALDPTNHTIAVRHSLWTREFSIPKDLDVLLNDDKPGALSDLQLGQTVNVTYELGHGGLVARQIEQPDASFTGTIEAIDVGSRVIKAKSLLSEKKFNLADGCRIVVEGKLNGRLQDLRIGEGVEITYADVDGVLVANRVGQDLESSAGNRAADEKVRAQAQFWQGLQPLPQ